MRILIVSGFLGAGKTTFIQAMARATGLPLVVYENEYAGVGVDARRLEQDAGIEVFESLENCACCSGRGDFAQSLLTIHASLDPEYLVVEPTGLARLGNLLETVRQVMYGDMELLPPVVVADAAAFGTQRGEAVFREQLAHAGTVVLSKRGRLLPAELARVREGAAALAPGAAIADAPFGELGTGWFRALLEPPAGRGSAFRRDGRAAATAGPGAAARRSACAADAADAEEAVMERFDAEDARIDSPAHLAFTLDSLACGGAGGVVRAKGALPGPGGWVRFDLAGESWEIAGCEPQPSPQLAVIGRDLDAAALAALFPHALLRRAGEAGHAHDAHVRPTHAHARHRHAEMRPRASSGHGDAPACVM